jgi:hypothetical protein
MVTRSADSVVTARPSPRRQPPASYRKIKTRPPSRTPTRRQGTFKPRDSAADCGLSVPSDVWVEPQPVAAANIVATTTHAVIFKPPVKPTDLTDQMNVRAAERSGESLIQDVARRVGGAQQPVAVPLDRNVSIMHLPLVVNRFLGTLFARLFGCRGSRPGVCGGGTRGPHQGASSPSHPAARLLVKRRDVALIRQKPRRSASSRPRPRASGSSAATTPTRAPHCDRTALEP